MEESGRPSRWTELAAAAALLVAAFVLTGIGVRGPRVLTFQLGPNDHLYLSGFVPHYEVEDDVAYRWTTYDARIELPLVLEGGPAEISYRFARVFAETATAELTLDATTLDRFTARGGSIETRRVRLPALSSTPLSIGLLVDSHERRNLGLKLDWVVVAVGSSARLYLRGIARWLPPALALVFYALFRWAGLGRSTAFALGCAFLVAIVLAAHRDVLGTAYALLHLTLMVVVLSTAAAAFFRRRPGGSWVVPIFVAGYLLRGFGLFHPQTFYPDVANARDYVEIFRETSGSLAERGVATQEKTNVGYPRTVAGKAYAFPYSPLYFLPFSLAPTPGAIEDWVRHAGLAASMLELLPLFVLASAIFSPRAGVVASLLWIVLPPIFSRLLLALHATVVGNLLDTLMIASALALASEPESRKRFAAVFGTMLASLLVYTSSLFSVSAFVFFESLLERKLAWRLLGALLACGALTVSWLYGPFLVALFTEILPALARGLSPSAGESEPSPVGLALSRIPLFYGFGYPVLAAAGLVLARRRAGPRAFRVLLAWTLAFLLMVALRAFGAGLFKDLKEITFVAPLVAILAGASLVALADRGRLPKLAAIAVTLGLVGFGIARYRGYLELYQTPVTAPPPVSMEGPL